MVRLFLIFRLSILLQNRLIIYGKFKKSSLKRQKPCPWNKSIRRGSQSEQVEF